VTKRANEGLGVNAYARHRAARGLPGGTRSAVQQAIKSGRLAASVAYVAGHPRIRDVDTADREWAASTKVDRVPLANGEGSSSALVAARTRREMALALIAEDEVRQRRGELVEVAGVVQELTTILVNAKSKLLAIPSKMKQRCPHLTVVDVGTIDSLIRESLEELAAHVEAKGGRADGE
jgi:phage terminase Nu1 subunit (DNA packaging protein)